MSQHDELTINQGRLVDAWRRTLPTVINKSDSSDVFADEADSKSLRVHIATAGHTQYSFDFKCTYVDSREIKVELVDVERDGQSVDERTGVIQTMIEDYVRHLHECAQQLHAMTSGS
ncbi:hypothetical protein [Paenibacillus hamazuiensis]|uniref:hypothetical protein n=1 Tax=Paenibacillus hamazuiensis TaxID=2936508 RepID=UPI00200CA0FB|nr:hypothetical protein [Paenibacillus hamazuiensis]